MLCVLAAVAGIVATFRTAPAVVRGVAAGIVLAAAGLTVWAWLSIPSVDLSGGMQWSASTEPAGEFGDIVRDDLVLIDISGLTHEVMWGLYAGIGSMLVLALALAAGPLPGGRPPQRASAG
ncbi:hypothetical protein JCM9534A_63480 [Catenuloplanes indicus JCM 9534]